MEPNIVQAKAGALVSAKQQGFVIPEVMAQTLSSPGPLMKFGMTCDVKDAARLANKEHCRLLLARSAIENIAGLSLFAAHMGNSIPRSSHRLEVLVDACTAASAAVVLYW